MKKEVLNIVKEIMCAGGFPHVEAVALNNYRFYTDDYECAITMPSNTTIGGAVNRLTQWHENRGFESGKADTQHKIKLALGLPTE